MAYKAHHTVVDDGPSLTGGILDEDDHGSWGGGRERDVALQLAAREAVERAAGAVMCIRRHEGEREEVAHRASSRIAELALAASRCFTSDVYHLA